MAEATLERRPSVPARVLRGIGDVGDHRRREPRRPPVLLRRRRSAISRSRCVAGVRSSGTSPTSRSVPAPSSRGPGRSASSSPWLLHRHASRARGVQGARAHRRRGVLRLRVGVRQHARDHAAHRRHHARRASGGRVHRRARRHAHLRGDRRDGGHRRPSDPVPRLDADRRRLHRRHPAVPDRALRLVLRDQAHRRQLPRSVRRDVRALLRAVPSAAATSSTR